MIKQSKQKKKVIQENFINENIVKTGIWEKMSINWLSIHMGVIMIEKYLTIKVLSYNTSVLNEGQSCCLSFIL